MRRRDLLSGALAGAALLSLPRAWAAGGQRLVTLGGAVTELVFAAGAGGLVVGVDSSSLYPSSATSLPQVGYHRQISAEGVLALAPTDVLATEETGPPAALQQLQAAGVRVGVFDAAHDPVAAIARAKAVAAAVGRAAEGEAIARQMTADFDAAKALAAKTGSPRVLFLYARAGGTLNVAGQDTAADAMIQIAGGRNAATGFTGYRALTAEAALAAAPDVVLLTTSGLASAGGAAGVWAAPGLSLTPAGKNGRLIAHDDLTLLGFGPRAGQAAQALARDLSA